MGIITNALNDFTLSLRVPMKSGRRNLYAVLRLLWRLLRRFAPRNNILFNIPVSVFRLIEKGFLDQAGKDMTYSDVDFLNSLSLLGWDHQGKIS